MKNYKAGKQISSNFKLDFIGIGAEKSGTTWLADCLAEHPEIYIPPGKELFFFNQYDPHFLETRSHRYDKWGISWYKKQFKKCRSGQIKGEFTPTYLYCETAARRIKKHFPNIKIISILRDPSERAFSQYLNDKKIGLNKGLNFAEVLQKHDSYIEKGLYYKHLKTYFSLFPEKNMFILLFEDIKNNPKNTIQRVYRFLGVKNTHFVPPSLNKKSNTASGAKFSFLNSFMVRIEYFLMNKGLARIHKILEISGIRKFALRLRDFNTEKIDEDVKLKKIDRKNLKKFFQSDIQKLQKIIKRDLSGW